VWTKTNAWKCLGSVDRGASVEMTQVAITANAQEGTDEAWAMPASVSDYG